MARIGETADLLKCSFCGKSQKQVKKLIAGPNVYICDECIELCNEIIRMRTLLEQMIATATGKAPEDVSRDVERDKILTAEQAVEYGLIDAVIESRKGVPALT